MSKTIKAVFGAGQTSKTYPQWQYDYNTILQFVGLDLPSTFEVDLANSKTGQSTTVLGDADGCCTIPAQYFIPGTSIFAWAYIVDSNSGYTRCQVEIPISPRAQHTGDSPTPEQQSALDQAIALLNAATDNIPNEINAALTEAKESGEFDGEPGEDGYSPTVEVDKITGGHQVTITDKDGPHQFDVMDGEGGGSAGDVVFFPFTVDYEGDLSVTPGPGASFSAIKSAVENGKSVFALVSLTGYSGKTQIPLAGFRNDALWFYGGIVEGEYNLVLSGFSNDYWQAQKLSLLDPLPYSSKPKPLGIANAGTKTVYARGDHVHPMPSAADIGAYVKPAGGIPASDIASGVIPSVPTNVSAFANDAGYLTQHQSLAGYATQQWVQQQGYLTQHQDISGKLDVNQGASNVGKFLVVGSDGNITTVSMTAWQGGSY